MKRMVTMAILLMSGAAAFPQEVDERSAILESQCMLISARMGKKPKPNCECSAYSNSTKILHVYKFNAMGLRDHDHKPQPAKDEARILLMGVLLDGAYLPNDQSPAEVLERALAAATGKNVQVIHGTVQGYKAWRLSEFAGPLLKAYSPRLVVYFQSGLSLALNLIEGDQLGVGSDGEFVGYHEDIKPIAAPVFLSWLWPSVSTQVKWMYAWRRFQLIRSLHGQEVSLATAMVGPFVKAMRKVERQLGNDQKLLLIFDGRPAYLRTLAEGPQWLLDLLDRFAPPVRVSARAIVGEFKRSNVDFVVLEGDARSMSVRDLISADSVTSLSEQGIRAFVRDSQSAILERLKISVGKVDGNLKLPTENKHE